MNALIRGLTWPVVVLLVVGGSHLLAELLRPALQAVITPPVVMPIYLAVGGWGAFATVRAGGGVPLGFVAGAVLGLLPAALQLVGFGIILGRPSDVVATSGDLRLLRDVLGRRDRHRGGRRGHGAGRGSGERGEQPKYRGCRGVALGEPVRQVGRAHLLVRQPAPERRRPSSGTSPPSDGPSDSPAAFA